MGQHPVTYHITLRGRQVALARPWVMGILNVTPDSFYHDSRSTDEAEIIARVRQMVDEGADIIDVGGYSSRPGAEDVPLQEEMARVSKALHVIKREAPQVYVSVDTFRAAVARCAVEELGADMVNDISGGDLDPDMHRTVAQLQVPYVAMHMRGTPKTMQHLTDYDNLVCEVVSSLRAQVDALHDCGVTDVIVDPGFGFGKTLDQNYELLARLGSFRELDVPLLVGMSRKSMLSRLLGVTAQESLNATTVVNTIALLQGAHFLRVHDVRQAVECRAIVEKTLRAAGYATPRHII